MHNEVIPARGLVCGVNWIGDTIMSLPALQEFRRRHPQTELTLLVKAPLVPLWRMSPVPAHIVVLETGLRGTWRTARALRAGGFDGAWVLPHSFRAALVPWLAGIPRRTGLPGHARDFLLTRVVLPTACADRRHQAYEYSDLLLAGESPPAPLSAPELRVPAAAQDEARRRLAGLPAPRIGLMPGAARGPAKEWPAAHFAELAQRLARDPGAGLVILGSARERAAAALIAQQAGGRALDLAGATTLPEWAALLQACDLVVANDSGGMHLAAAVGTQVVALFGMTDPAVTGPLGRRCRVLQISTERARAIRRDSAAARASLAAIIPETVAQIVRQLLAGGRAGAS